MLKRRAESLHKAAVKRGKVVEFYKPQPKQVNAVDEEIAQPPVSAGDILRELLGAEETIHEVLVLTRDKAGFVAMVGNIEGAGENLLFMEYVKHEMLSRLKSDGPKGAS